LDDGQAVITDILRDIKDHLSDIDSSMDDIRRASYKIESNMLTLGQILSLLFCCAGGCFIAAYWKEIIAFIVGIYSLIHNGF